MPSPPPVNVPYYAYDTTNKVGKTGDAANHAVWASVDGGPAVTVSSPTQIDAAKLPGWYYGQCDPTSLGLTTGRFIVVGGTSTTAGVVLPGHLLPNLISFVGQVNAVGSQAINDASFNLPAEAAGRPTGALGMLRRIFEASRFGNKRTRNRTTGNMVLRNQADTADLVTATQSSATAGGATTDTISKGA